MMSVANVLEGEAPAEVATLEEVGARADVWVHDSSRLAWQMSVPVPREGSAHYAFELEIEAPVNVAGAWEPWAALQTYARLDGADPVSGAPAQSLEAFRRCAVEVSLRLARAREGFVRHCRLVRACPEEEPNPARSLILWLEACSAELSNARAKLLAAASHSEEAKLADEFLSGRLWTVLTDCARTLLETRRVLDERASLAAAFLDDVENVLTKALARELAYRQDAHFSRAEEVDGRRLQPILARMRSLKKHFERAVSLDVQSYQVVRRMAGWLSAAVAMVAYLWFLFCQITLDRHQGAIGSGVIALALVTAVAYASRERLKEVGRDWLAGRIQHFFAQRVTRCALPAGDRSMPRAFVVSARESFSQSSVRRPDPVHPEDDSTHNVTSLRFIHRGVVQPTRAEQGATRQVRLIYRLDLSGLFPRLHDPVRGLACIDPRTGGVAIVDVPRDYELPVRVSLRSPEGQESRRGTLVLNKNGLLRFEDDTPSMPNPGAGS
jgi:hypothetical protein